MKRLPAAILTLILLCSLVPGVSKAQYFGRNKVKYDQFDFRSFKTDHFEIYYYPESEEKIKDVARMSERWYQRHTALYGRSFEKRKPLIFYANDADFHQTNVTDSQLGEGTGGFTEPLKERVVLPLTGIYADTDHVLGHELVHSFQYDLGLNAKGEEAVSLRYIPLWLIEGTAEYLSTGREDPHTAMWMRDAAIRDDLPTTSDMTRRPDKYFPYRFGQAYMAYIGGLYGDEAVIRLFKRAGRGGVDSAIVEVTGLSPDSLSKNWASAIKDAYLPLVEDRTPSNDAGRLVLSKKSGSGDINLAPSISPDGKYVAFLSERDLYRINLFIADAESGKIVRDLGTSGTRTHFDSIRFISSAGSWSPDGSRFAFITFAHGDNEIAIMDTRSGKVKRRIKPEGVTAITNVAWSPDGNMLAFSGMVGGVSDLYLYNMEDESVRQLTDDKYADIHPAWSPDGKSVAFSTDRGSDGSDFSRLIFSKPRIGVIHVETGTLRVLRPFGNASHINPQYSADGHSLFFISDYDGFKDLYRYDLRTNQAYQVTRLQTGVSGITALSPAMSIAAQTGRMMFSVFEKGTYHVYSLETENLEGELIELRDPGSVLASVDTDITPDDVSEKGGFQLEEARPSIAGVLPPFTEGGQDRVRTQLGDPLTGLPAKTSYSARNYRPRLKLDYVAPPVLGASFGGPYGGGIYGGTQFYFSDMLGEHIVVSGVLINGGITDVGGSLGYLNRKRRLNWGGSISRSPIRFQNIFFGIDENGFLVQDLLTQEMKIDQASGFLYFPLSSTRRIEFGAGATRWGLNIDVERFAITGTGRLESIDKLSVKSDAVYFATSSMAFVGDNSYFGLTSPIDGTRYRLELMPFTGSPGSFLQVRADYRKYLRRRPLTFAFRGLHVGNYGSPIEDDPGTLLDERLFTEQYLGWSNSNSFVRGYRFYSIDTATECTPAADGSCGQISRLLGSRVALVSAEVRLPLLGVRPLSAVNFPLPVDVGVFYDAGLAWNADDNFIDLLQYSTTSPERIPVTSAGFSARFNLLGFAILETYLARPFQRPEAGWQFGLQIVPGW